MNISKIIIGKKTYCPPNVEIIKLDKEISLAMESDAPAGPGEGKTGPQFQKEDPFKTHMG